MKSFLQLPLFAFIAFMVQLSAAQKAERPDQDFNLGAKINQIELTQGGVLIVATNNGIAGILPDQEHPLFFFKDFGAIKPEEMSLVPNSPYLIISQGATGQFAALSKTKRAVIDYMQGKVIFNSDTDNWNQVYTCNIALPENKLIISGLRKEGDKAEKITPRVAVYDLATAKLDFSFFLDKPGRVGVGKDFSVTGTPLLLQSAILIPTAQGIIAKSHQGEELWKNKVKDIRWMVADKKQQEIYAFEGSNNGKNTRIHKIGINGGELWKDDRKVKGEVVNFEILPLGLAVVSNKSDGGSNSIFSQKNESEIAFLSASSGEDLWDKAPKTKGYVQHFYVMDDGILFGIQQGGINKISFEGKPLFKKPLKTGENIMVMANSPQGLIYITSEDANIVNLKTGEEVWSKPLKYKASNVASTFDSANKRYFISADEKVYAIDASSGTVSDFAKCKFDEKEEANQMEMRNGNVYLSSSQNLMLLDENGGQLYHQYFKSPGKSGFMKVMSGVVAAASMVGSVAMSAKAGANRTGFGSSNDLDNYNEYGKEAKRAADMFSGIASASFKLMTQRFKASAATENAQFILTQLDNGVGLVKINKDSGAVEKEILLKDKKPTYKVDGLGGFLFYQAGDSNIYVYNLKA